VLKFLVFEHEHLSNATLSMSSSERRDMCLIDTVRSTKRGKRKNREETGILKLLDSRV